MMNGKQEQAWRLFRALEEIDDCLIAEAIAAQKSGSARSARRHGRYALLTIAASILLAISLGVLGGGVLRGILQKPPQAPSAGNESAAGDLPTLLLACTESPAFSKQATLAVPADGAAHLLIGTRSGDALWVSRPLNTQEMATVGAELQTARRQDDFTAPSAEPYLIWYTDGNGNVWSPCLTGNAGNITFGYVYDYQSERAPSSTFCQLLSELIG